VGWGDSVTDNIIIIGIIVFILAATIYFLFKNDYSKEEEEVDEYSIDYLWVGVKERMNVLTDTSDTDYSLSKETLKKEEAKKLELMKALRTCGYGNLNAKNFVKDYIKRILQRDFNISEGTINNVLPFEHQAKLTSLDKFEILLYLYKKQYDLDAFYQMVLENEFDKLKGTGTREDEYHYEISKEDIDELFNKTFIVLDYLDKLEIITQRVYSRYLGNGVIDEIRDMKKIDGVSAGLSGVPNDYYNFLEEYMIANRNEIEYYYNSIWCMFQGKTIHISALGFGSEAEMMRIVKKIYRYDDPGYLSEDEGYIISSMSDGSRIVVVRPKVGENWAFFIRKLNSIEDISIENLLTDVNADKAIQIMSWIVKGCCNIAVTGKQFSGKTTILKALGEFINPQFNIGIQEMIFELHYKNLRRYRHRNVMTLRDTASVTAQSIMDLLKKMDRDVYIFGEVHSPEAVSLVIQASLAGSRQIMLSHHAKTTPYLIDSFKVALQIARLFPSEIKTAEEQVARSINFDFHMNTTVEGHIYLERITEIVPDTGEQFNGNLKDSMITFFKKMTDERRYITRDIVIFKEGSYRVVNTPSDKTREKIAEFLSEEQLKEYDEFFVKAEEAVA
jgi:pilus assembly protein CpaF